MAFLPQNMSISHDRHFGYADDSADNRPRTRGYIHRRNEITGKKDGIAHQIHLQIRFIFEVPFAYFLHPDVFYRATLPIMVFYFRPPCYFRDLTF